MALLSSKMPTSYAAFQNNGDAELIKDSAELRGLLRSFHQCQGARTIYLAGGAHNKKKMTELLIMNY
jgi:hypothetical protein